MTLKEAKAWVSKGIQTEILVKKRELKNLQDKLERFMETPHIEALKAEHE